MLLVVLMMFVVLVVGFGCKGRIGYVRSVGVIVAGVVMVVCVVLVWSNPVLFRFLFGIVRGVVVLVGVL